MLREALNCTAHYFHHLERTQIEKLKLNTKPKTKAAVRLSPGVPIQFFFKINDDSLVPILN